MKRLFVLLLLPGFLFVSPARGDAPTIEVREARATIAHRLFDPAHPPRDMPLFVPGEAGLCHYEFTTDIQAAGDIDTLAPGKVNVTIDTAIINLSLPITIWLERGAPKRIIEHEDGHRSICEYYYANMDVYARRAAQACMGKVFSGEGKDKQAAVDDAMNKAISQMTSEIMAQTRVRAVACNTRYDKITDHSRNPGSQAEAAAKAESVDPEPKGGRPATQPAGGAKP